MARQVPAHHARHPRKIPQTQCATRTGMPNRSSTASRRDTHIRQNSSEGTGSILIRPEGPNSRAVPRTYLGACRESQVFPLKGWRATADSPAVMCAVALQGTPRAVRKPGSRLRRPIEIPTRSDVMWLTVVWIRMPRRSHSPAMARTCPAAQGGPSVCRCHRRSGRVRGACPADDPGSRAAPRGGAVPITR